MHLGIDFGTAYTKIGIIQNGQFTNLNQPHTLPSVVSYSPAARQLIFGLEALRIADPGTVTSSLFKLNLKRNLPYQLGPYNLPQIMYHFFAFAAAHYISPTLEPATVTISIPNYFGLHARQIIKTAAAEAFPSAAVSLLPEPVAALLGYNFDNTSSPLQGDILCIDMGGGTTDFSFISNSQQQQEILVESQLQIGSDIFSGAEIDRAILKNLLFPLYEKQNHTLVPDAYISEKFTHPGQSFHFTRLLQLAEKIKIEVQDQGQAYINIPDFLPGSSLTAVLQIKDLQTAVLPVFNRLENYINDILKNQARELGLYNGGQWQIEQVLLLGGTSYTRGVAELLQRYFPGTALITPPDRELNVIKGLCAYAGYYQSLFTVRTIYPFNFYIENRTHSLDKIPFDTANLDLDLKQTYKIYSLEPGSPYNLSDEENRLQARIYEIETETTPRKRFMGQDLVLNIDIPLPDKPADIYLDLDNCCLTTTAHPNEYDDSRPRAPLLLEMPESDSFLAFMQSNPVFDPRLRQDYQEFTSASRPENLADLDYIQASLYKVLSLLQFYKTI